MFTLQMATGYSILLTCVCLVCTCVCECTCMHVCVYVCAYVCVCVRARVCVCWPKKRFQVIYINLFFSFLIFLFPLQQCCIYISIQSYVNWAQVTLYLHTQLWQIDGAKYIYEIINKVNTKLHIYPRSHPSSPLVIYIPHIFSSI